MDVFTRSKRSQVMARIRGRGNRGTELALRVLLKLHGITGWRRHYPIPGCPDFAFLDARLAIFVDGCFWHQCPKCSTIPVQNRGFWKRKLSANVVRDRRINRLLRSKGWAVLRVWEHALEAPGPLIRRLKAALARRGVPTA